MSKRLEPMPALLDRQRERALLDGLLGDLRLGRGRALVVRGEAGVGKSALLEYATRAADMRVAGAAGWNRRWSWPSLAARGHRPAG
jgi:hypothetical protein